MGLSDSPPGPACPSRGAGRPRAAGRGLPCCACVPVPTCPRHYPGETVRSEMLVIGRHWPSPLSGGVGSLIVPFEACSAFTHVRACWLAELPEAVLDTG